MPELFKSTVIGIGPFCVEFEDGEIVHTRSESRQKQIAASADLLEACRRISAAPHGVAIGDLEFLNEAISKAT